MKAIFSVDVEDWFHVLDLPGAPRPSEWESLPSRVEDSFRCLLDLFSANQARVTCFFLGWVAERFPHLVKEAAGRGHEIASHGYLHRLVYRMTRKEFLEDARRSRRLLEDTAGCRVLGYRAPGFSVNGKTPWFFDALAEAGYQYDSSVFPSPRGHGGWRHFGAAPRFVWDRNCRLLYEIPVTTASVLGIPLCYFGGGYLRLFPWPVIRNMARKVAREGRPVIFYVHPREIDPRHPRLSMNALRAFQSYVNLHTTRPKIERILKEFEVTTFAAYLAGQWQELRASAAAGATGGSLAAVWPRPAAGVAP